MRVFVLVGLCALAQLMVLVGCVAVTNDVDVSHVEPTCARQCTMAYSSCVSAPAVGTPSVLFYQCKEGLKLCTQTCPPKP